MKRNPHYFLSKWKVKDYGMWQEIFSVCTEIDSSYPLYLTFIFSIFSAIIHSYLCSWYQNFMLLYLHTQHVCI